MDFLTNLLAAIGGFSVLVAAFAWLTRTIVLHLLEKDVQSYKNRLETLAKEHAIRFAALHEKQGEAIAQIYFLLDTTLEGLQWFVNLYDQSIPEKQKLEEWVKIGDAFISFYRKNKIYFSTILACRLTSIVEELQKCTLFLSAVYEVPEGRLTEELRAETKKAIDKVLDDAELVKGVIEKEFRLILGVQDSEAEKDLPATTGPKRPWWIRHV